MNADSDAEETILTPYKYLMKKHEEGYDFHNAEKIIQSIFSPGNVKWDNEGLSSDIVDNVSLSDDESDEYDIESDFSQFDTRENQLETTQVELSYKEGKVIRKLREPRKLYTKLDEGSSYLPARWPIEIQVLENTPKHIDSMPTEREKFYQFGDEMEINTPVRAFDEDAKVVYLNRTVAMVKNFIRSSIGGNIKKPCDIERHSSFDENTLLFESRFESGNLEKAVKVGQYDYELFLRNDLYTNKHTQWYYFRIRNAVPNKEYTFTIVNLVKTDSLYNYGMRPLFYSELDAYKYDLGWVRCGYSIKYYQNGLRRSGKYKDKYYYSLTWKSKFNNVNDTCYFAHCYPYTYTKLQEYLHKMCVDPIKKDYCKLRILCQTIAGNHVYLVTITSPNPNSMPKPRKIVVVTARVHPGETNSSWMMKGFLDFICGYSDDAKLLREMFIFKIVPMINPDGVIVGNYRCSLVGRDLNRSYCSSLTTAYPAVCNIRTMVQRLLKEREVVLFCDMHGHSKKQNSFMYGCENRVDNNLWLKERIFPNMMSVTAPDMFSFKSCKFKIQKYKEGTARVAMWRLGILNSFTFEASFCGSTLGQKSGYHFSTIDYQALGASLCDTLLDYCDPDNSKAKAIYCDLLFDIKQRIVDKFKEKSKETELNEKNIRKYLSEVESDTQGSNSSLSDGSILNFVISDGIKVKKLRSRKERSQRRHQNLQQIRPQTADPRYRHRHEAAEGGRLVAIELKPSNLTSGKFKRFVFRRQNIRDDKKFNDGVPVYVQERIDERAAKKDIQEPKMAICSNARPFKDRTQFRPSTSHVHAVRSLGDIETLFSSPQTPVLSVQELPTQVDQRISINPPTAYSRSLGAYGAGCLRSKSQILTSKRNEDQRNELLVEGDGIESKIGNLHRISKADSLNRSGLRSGRNSMELQLQTDPIVKNAPLNYRDPGQKFNYTPSSRPPIYPNIMNTDITTSKSSCDRKIDDDQNQLRSQVERITSNHRIKGSVIRVQSLSDLKVKLETSHSIKSSDESMSHQQRNYKNGSKLSNVTQGFTVTSVKDLRRALSVQK